MPWLALSGKHPAHLLDLGRALSGHRDLAVRGGPGPARLYHALRAVVGIRAKDPQRPWEPDPEWVCAFAEEETRRAFPPTERNVLVVDANAPLEPSVASVLAREVYVGEAPPAEGRLVLAADELRQDAGIDRLFAHLGIADDPMVRAVLRAIRPPETAVPPALVAAREWVRRLDADEPGIERHLAEARAHPDVTVRAAATRLLVRRGLDPEAAELVCGTRLVHWSAPA